MELQRGMRDKLDKYLDLNSTIEVEMSINGPGEYDFCCFGVDSQDQLSDDRYMVFYNQPTSPGGEISYTGSGNTANFVMQLAKLPQSIQKLVFTVSIDGNSTMGNIGGHSFIIKQNGNNALNLTLNGTDFEQEKAIITVEIYRKDVWRINAIARGFNGGLADLLKNYGGEEESDASACSPAPAGPTQMNQAPAGPTPMNQAPAGPTPMNQAPAGPTPMNQAPAGPTPMNQAPAGPTPMNQAPAGPTPMNQAPAGPTPMNQAPAGPTPMNQAPAGPTQMNQGPMMQGPTGPTQMNQGPMMQSPTGPAPMNQGPMMQGPTQMNQGPMMQGPTGPTQMNQGPMMQGPTGPTPMNQGPMMQGPTGPTPMNQGPMMQGPTGPTQMNQGPMMQGPTGPTPMNQGPMMQGPTGPTPMMQTTAPKVSLEKKLKKDAPKLVSLAKPIEEQIQRHNLQDAMARVALVMDISGSMSKRYGNGTVQEIVNHVLPLAVQFDDDGQLDFWYYGSVPRRMDTVNMKNYMKAVPKNWNDIMKQLGYGNNEPRVMELVINEYQNTKLPAYVIFVTDGGVGNADKIKELMVKSSSMPIFWQFVGVGGSNYGVLEELDDMTGRYVDNADFFALDDFKTVPDKELYDRLLTEFPTWLHTVRSMGMI